MPKIPANPDPLSALSGRLNRDACHAVMSLGLTRAEFALCRAVPNWDAHAGMVAHHAYPRG
jgi:hypothetical protein